MAGAERSSPDAIVPHVSVIDSGRTVWKAAHADRASFIIDACDYYRTIRQAMLEAKQRILIVGWDFDPRIKLDRTDEANDHETLGSFLLGLAKERPNLEIKILKWDFGILKFLFRGSAVLWLARLAAQRSITFKLDGAHPPGCSHHQKIVVIDDSFAICGGIDMSGDRWDRPSHEDDDPDRVRPSGRHYGPWHDTTMAVQGDIARVIGEAARNRWKRATGEKLAPVRKREPLWPDGLDPHFRNIDIGVARTIAKYKTYREVKEIEALFLAMIASAKRSIYAESQYFASPRIAAAIRARLMEKNPPEIVLINPIRADGWLEQTAMDATRVRLGQVIGQSDPANRFRIYTPVTKGGDDIYVHSKVLIVDDRMMKVGSANMNNRSLGLDSECDLIIEAKTPAQRKRIASLRTRLLAEHLGVREETVDRKLEETGSLLATIEALKGRGKTLRLLKFEKPSEAGKFIADAELLDPKSPDVMFEDMTSRSLFSSFGGLRDRVTGG